MEQLIGVLKGIRSVLVINKTLYPHNMTREQWRHELAARAMQGMMGDYIPERWCNEEKNISELDIIKARCYAVADAMLEEGDK